MLTNTDLEIIKQIINDARDELKEDITLFKDQILKEIIDLRDDVTVVTSYRDMIEDHAIRIHNLEKNRFAN